MGVSRMTKEHLGISLALKVPIFIVITKIDIAPASVYEETKTTLIKILKSPGC
jgi:elongation factor 1-alpha